MCVCMGYVYICVTMFFYEVCVYVGVGVCIERTVLELST